MSKANFIDASENKQKIEGLVIMPVGLLPVLVGHKYRGILQPKVSNTLFFSHKS